MRLLQSGIVKPEDLARKYAKELWANEIMLLAYYIACVNIETTYQSIMLAASSEHELEDMPYVPFPGATLTDTFQITEEGDRADTSLMPVNNERIEAQLAKPIRVIVGNPPYSAGQSSANDNNQNLKYPTLDRRIADTYALHSTATNKNSLYDSYIRAFRWASDRIEEHGVVAFVSNNGWVDGNTADGLRKCIAKEFSDIWVYNLRGNQRTAGEQLRREGGKVFGSGARTGVAVFVAVKRADAEDECRLHYYEVPDYQSAEVKLSTLNEASLATVNWRNLTPNDAGDWVSQRDERFATYPALTGQGLSYFTSSSRGLETTRDAWCYNFSAEKVASNMQRMIDVYNAEAARGVSTEAELESDPQLIKWSSSLSSRALRGQRHEFDHDGGREVLYRPFSRQRAYLDRVFVHRPGKNFEYFPTPEHENWVLYVPGAGSSAPPFFTLSSSSLIDLGACGISSAISYPRYRYEQVHETHGSFDFGGDIDEHGYRKIDNITDEILAHYVKHFGPYVTKDDIFAYVYAVLHSPQYRETFKADLKRSLPRIPLAASAEDFRAFVTAGQELLDLHLHYESIDPYPLHVTSTVEFTTDEYELYRVEKMKWADKGTKMKLVVNSRITLRDFPAEVHEYMLGARSAVDWLIDRYQVKIDKASGIVNDPNDWAREHDDPSYIVDLIRRVTRVSVNTVRIANSLPHLPL